MTKETTNALNKGSLMFFKNHIEENKPKTIHYTNTDINTHTDMYFNEICVSDIADGSRYTDGRSRAIIELKNNNGSVVFHSIFSISYYSENGYENVTMYSLIGDRVITYWLQIK